MNSEFPENPRAELEAKLTALLLGELPQDEAATLRETVARDPQLAKLFERLQQTIQLVRQTETSPVADAVQVHAPLRLSEERRQALLQKFKTVAPKEFTPVRGHQKRFDFSWLVPAAVAAALMVFAGTMFIPSYTRSLSRGGYKVQRWSFGDTAAVSSSPPAENVAAQARSSLRRRTEASDRRGKAEEPGQPITTGRLDGSHAVQHSAEPVAPAAAAAELSTAGVASGKRMQSPIVLPSSGTSSDIKEQLANGAAANTRFYYETEGRKSADKHDFFTVDGADSSSKPVVSLGFNLNEAKLEAQQMDKKIDGLSDVMQRAGNESAVQHAQNSTLPLGNVSAEEEFLRRKGVGDAEQKSSDQAEPVHTWALDEAAKLELASQPASGGQNRSGAGGRGLGGGGGANFGLASGDSAGQPLDLAPPAQIKPSTGLPVPTAAPVVAGERVVSEELLKQQLDKPQVVAGAKSPAKSDRDGDLTVGDKPMLGRYFRRDSENFGARSEVQPTPSEIVAGKDVLRTPAWELGAFTVTNSLALDFQPDASKMALNYDSDLPGLVNGQLAGGREGTSTAGVLEEGIAGKFDARDVQRKLSESVTDLALGTTVQAGRTPNGVSSAASSQPVSGPSNVYDLNVVGYYNAPVAAGRLAIPNQINTGTDMLSAVGAGSGADQALKDQIPSEMQRRSDAPTAMMTPDTLTRVEKLSAEFKVELAKEKQVLQQLKNANPGQVPPGMESKAAALDSNIKSLDSEIAKARNEDARAKSSNQELALLNAKRNLKSLQREQQILDMKIATEGVEPNLPKTSMVEIVDLAKPAVKPMGLRGLFGDAVGRDYRSTARFRVQPNSSDVGFTRPQSTTVYDPRFIQSEFEKIQSDKILGKVVHDLNLAESWGNKKGSAPLRQSEAVALLKQRMELKAVKDTGLVELSVKSDKPAEAAQIANAVASAYQDGAREESQRFSQEGIRNLELQYSQTEQKLAKAQAEVDRLEQKKKLVETDAALPKPSPNAPIPQPEIQTCDNAFSTFSLNISDVSFKLAAASLEKGVMPDPTGIRSEEFINAFDYLYPEAPPGVPVAFAWDRAQYPFAQNRDLLRFSLKTAAQGRQPGRPLNLVLLLDNSGSMERADRVRIIHEALHVLAKQLQAQDKLSIITFSRTARLVADGVAGSQAGKAVDEVDGLTPQGGTNLEEAMNLAYQTALRHYQANGMNRVVLLTDGAANLGNVEPEALKKNVEDHRKQGVALDCFGIGWEGYNDDLLEVMSRNGDGRYGFINTPEEASTEFASKLAGALHVAASDVKVQVEFNPKRVTAYRQVGYAKHQLTKQQFRDNTVDAAEIAAAEAGNALYVVEVNAAGEGPLATVRVRYKDPGTTEFHEHEWPVPYTGNAMPLEQAGPAMRLAASAGSFSEWLAGNPYASEVSPDRVLGLLSGVPEVYGADARPKKLEWMLRQAKSLMGK